MTKNTAGQRLQATKKFKGFPKHEKANVTGNAFYGLMCKDNKLMPGGNATATLQNHVCGYCV